MRGDSFTVATGLVNDGVQFVTGQGWSRVDDHLDQIRAFENRFAHSSTCFNRISDYSILGRHDSHSDALRRLARLAISGRNRA